MKTRLLMVLAAGLVVGAADPAPDLGEVQSQVIPPGSRWQLGNDLVWEFRKDGALRIGDARDTHFVESPYTVDREANPPRIDIAGGDGAKRGIYRVEGDRLLICMGESASTPRPTRFVYQPDRGYHCVALQRLK